MMDKFYGIKLYLIMFKMLEEKKIKRIDKKFATKV